MKLSEVKEILKGKIISGESRLDEEVDAAFGSDLMSDVLAFVEERVLLLTGLVNPQVVRTAEMMDISAIVFVRGKTPDESVIELAKAKDMVIITTDYSMYVASGKLYFSGLKGKNGEE
jgi:predicted transcriptional regulator